MVPVNPKEKVSHNSGCWKKHWKTWARFRVSLGKYG